MDKKDLKLKSLQKHLELSEPIDMKYVTASDFLTDIVVKYVANENIELTDKQKEGFKKSYNFIKSKEEQKDVEPIGNYIGNIKQRYDMTLKYISTNNTSRGYYVHNFEDRKGNSLICFSDNERIEIIGAQLGLEEGDCFTCKATVNRHTVNRFSISKGSFPGIGSHSIIPTKQTVINRIKYKRYLGNKIDKETRTNKAYAKEFSS